MKKDKDFLKHSFHEARVVIYFAFFLNCFIAYKFKPCTSLCDDGTVQCALCGMRHAVDKLLQLDLVGAFKSNGLVVLFAIIGLIAIIDTILYFLNNRKVKKAIFAKR